MTQPAQTGRYGLMSRLRDSFAGWKMRRIADPKFQAWATRFPLTRPSANAHARALYDLVAGFVYSQTLAAVVELDLAERVRRKPRSITDLAAELHIPPPRLRRLCQAAAALDLLRTRPGDRYGLGKMGAALLGAPGVTAMVRHHTLLYSDLSDPVALLKENGPTELSRYWSYVQDPRAMSQAEAQAYSDLMAASQAMVAAETLAVTKLDDITMLLDVGGGQGAFLRAVLDAYPRLHGMLFDLPAVAHQAAEAFEQAGLSERTLCTSGSFQTDDLPTGADAISLIRVLYDHEDDTVRALLARAMEALPAGGRLILSEPMSGGDTPTREGDAYFGFYTLAMTSGRPRSVAEHTALLSEAGFVDIQSRRSRQPFITRVIEARKPQ